MNFKALAKDTAIYGMSSIVGRFLNYLLVPLYTYHIAAQSGGYGLVTNLYAYTGLILVVLTFGMETTLFRFCNKEGEDERKVYGTILRTVSFLAAAFVALVALGLDGISSALSCEPHPEYIMCMAVTVAFDAVQAIMFSRLRQQRKPVRFMLLKFSFIIPNILLNLFVFLLMPSIPAISSLYDYFDGGVGLIFFSNLLCTTMVFLGFGNELKGFTYGFDKALAKRLLSYSWPLMLLGLVGILNQVADKILYPYLVPGLEGKVQLGIYGACVKIAMVLAMLTQAFRYAYEPMVFSSGKDRNSPEVLAAGMKYFVLFGLLAWLGVMLYLPVLKYFIQPSYWEGLGVIPIVMTAELFMGVYFNLSFWYKLHDKTWWGAVMSAAGAAVMIVVNVIFVPKFGYMACAWGGVAGYGTSMLFSWIAGQRRYPINYDLKTISLFVVLAAAIYALSCFVVGRVDNLLLQLALNTVLAAIFAFSVLTSLKNETKHKEKEIIY